MRRERIRRFCRYTANGVVRWGMLDGQRLRELTPHPWSRFRFTGRRDDRGRVRLTAPVMPGKIVAVGLNYRAHARELGMPIPAEPILFMKPPSAVIGPGGRIYFPRAARRVDYEAELGVVIGRRARAVSASAARSYILGYTCLNDVTARDLQKRDGQWSRAKGFDTFCPVGPSIVRGIRPEDVRVQSFLNGILRQDSSTRDMIFSVPALVSFISGVMTLEPGDVIATGTPSGIGSMHRGDTVEVRIEGIGSLHNTVV